MKMPLAAIVLCFAALASTTAAKAQSASPYVAKCQMCHGATGLGDTPAGKVMGAHAFNSPGVMKESDADLIALIKNGKGKMPAFKTKLTDPEITALLVKIHSLQK
ncbi:MAG: cytochrome c [Acidobacteriaceae bacterium]